MLNSIMTVSHVIFALAMGGPDRPVAVESNPEAWTIDAAHTEVNFSVRHFFTPVSGQFADFEVEFLFDPENVEQSSVSARIAVASVDTGNDRRDAHLRSDDWFSADAHEYITFESTSVEQRGSDLLVTGDLTIKDVTRTIEFPIEQVGIQAIPEEMQGMIGAESVASFVGTLELDRRDFGVGVGSWAETAIVGPQVEIQLAIEAHKKIETQR